MAGKCCKKKRAKLIEIATNMMFNHAKWETVVRAMLLARCGWEHLQLGVWCVFFENDSRADTETPAAY